MCERVMIRFVGGPLNGCTRPVPAGAPRHEHHDRLETRVAVYESASLETPPYVVMRFLRFEDPPPVSEVTAGELYRRWIMINPARVARPELAAA